MTKKTAFDAEKEREDLVFGVVEKAIQARHLDLDLPTALREVSNVLVERKDRPSPMAAARERKQNAIVRQAMGLPSR